eukprot:TRINITY_DN12456_c0_g1_i1.p1 TRINITY_DN12456_c0_g1~~TRINITY_DN12456_c0_g1_i1.p1  ORF type:complete len:325 (+),score=93.50 TRINITY_DN12456_c0_g1_i1:86-1060(+)
MASLRGLRPPVRQCATNLLPGRLGGAPPGAQTARGFEERGIDRGATPHQTSDRHRNDSELSHHAQRLRHFVAVRSAITPEFQGLATPHREDMPSVAQALICGSDKISGNVANIILENAKSMSKDKLSLMLGYVERTAVQGRYQGRGNAERLLVDFLCENIDMVTRLPMRGVAATVGILCAAQLEKHAEVDRLVDCVMDRIEAGTLKDAVALIRMLWYLADSDFHCPWLFRTAQFHLALQVEFINPGALPMLVRAYVSSGYEADDLFEAIQAGAATRTPEENERIEKELGKDRHRPIPMIVRGAQQTWLDIPGFKQEKRGRKGRS